MPLLRLGFLHLAPVVGDLDGNRRLIEHGTTTAANHGADWVLSGELVVSGYDFEPLVGTDWIEPHPSAWLCRYAMLCGELNVSAFVSDPERTGAGLYNTAWAIGRNGEVLAAHRKLSPTPGSEDWSSPGSRPHWCSQHRRHQRSTPRRAAERHLDLVHGGCLTSRERRGYDCTTLRSGSADRTVTAPIVPEPTLVP